MLSLYQTVAFGIRCTRWPLFQTSMWVSTKKDLEYVFSYFLGSVKDLSKELWYTGIAQPKSSSEQELPQKIRYQTRYMWLSKAIMLRCPMAGRFSARHTYSRTCLQCAMGMIVHGLANLQCLHRDASNFARNIEPWWFRNWFTCPSYAACGLFTTSCAQVKDSWNENQCTLDIQAHLTKISCICFKSQCSKWQNFDQNRILG